MKLKTLLLSTILLSSVTMADNSAIKQEGVKYIKMLGGALKGELQPLMKADKSGMSALEFCTVKANDITNEVNKKLPANVKVRRTAVKVRNSSQNQPDALDMKIMTEYISAIDEKTFTPKDIKVVEDADTTRVYKPLLAQGACLKCHGTNISKEISKSLEENYPHDKAVNFKEGDLRGVIVAEIHKK
ncbi:Cytochrome c family protein [hydrothermal vent metagenome]|uniref:Cytochrome c family protein n=1 Tax=hydrothermal vent metagenome TaxID=652676 RepID=A0A1W1EBU2_9ZZZZ